MNLKKSVLGLAALAALSMANVASAASYTTTEGTTAAGFGTTSIVSGGTPIAGVSITGTNVLISGSTVVDQVSSTDVTTFSFTSAITSFGGLFNLNYSGTPNLGNFSTAQDSIIVTLFNGGTELYSACLFGALGSSTCGAADTSLKLDALSDYSAYFNIASTDAFNKVQISFANYGGHLTETYGVSNAVVTLATPVPEPETYALMLAGLGAIGFMSRRRKAQ